MQNSSKMNHVRCPESSFQSKCQDLPWVTHYLFAGFVLNPGGVGDLSDFFQI